MPPAIRIHSSRLGPATELIEFLTDLNSTYEHLWAFELIVREAKARYAEEGFFFRRPRGSSSRILRTIRRPADVVLPDEQLQLSRITFSSPGFWEAIGALNPLETLRQFVNDRHERRKDRQYRESLEARRLFLETEQLRVDVVKSQVELLRDLGIPDDRIRAAVVRHVSEPLKALEKHQDSGLIETATLVEAATAGEPSKSDA
jgi:hypothetical protein